MKLISHRGNVFGKNPEKENTPIAIQSALDMGIDVEIDVWMVDTEYYLGHDKPEHNISLDFLLSTDRFWLHAKNGDAFYNLLQYNTCNVFWHTTEDWILTSKKYIWTYPTKMLFPNSICVLPESGICGDINNCYGICSDNIGKYFYENNV